MFLRSEEWLKGKIDEFFADTSRSPAELIAAFDKAVEHIRILQKRVESDKPNERIERRKNVLDD